ncbi:heme-binding protein [Natrialbaceae archaeon AArc-T1-2]|uniref:heme-binding protein n=1 Tax=Natrialbaceae archaeon AArc-T1-2 TaxID=3053904 RepID=UPI00255AA3CC|nr:heme-binding protein [Natrialbaceae archaeon AArc-T1-2]WIV66451.1 heme-binding protein [Natrialbaceae archaeon AArc-T1-2]
MERREAPPTDEGWYVLHDFRSIDWDAWRDAPDHRRERAIEDGSEFLASCERLDDAEEGDSATFTVLGHEADLLVLHLRPSMAALDELERQFEQTAVAEFTDRTDSYVSVTEVSGYVSSEYFEDGEVDAGIENYIRMRLHPSIPDAEYVNFYPMDKRRGETDNWYDLPYDERAEHLEAHGEIGKAYAGKVTQVISSSIGFDDYEWGVTLFADDPTDIKDLLYEMRFDPSTSRYAEFGSFYVGRRFAPENLDAFLAGEAVSQEPAEGHDEGERGHPHAGAGDSPHGEGRPHGESDEGTDEGEAVRSELEDQGVYAGSPHGEDVHAVVLYSTADVDELFEEVDGLRTNFDHYDTHVKTAVYGSHDGGDENAVVSLWETERAAETAAGFLAELPDVVRQAGDDETDSWGTMGMFYTVKPDHREDFVGTFEDVGTVLSGMDGHRKSDLLVNHEDENDMFIASRWDSREDAMAFFRSDEFAETVEYGRDVLADRPRHVFLA